MAHQPTTPALPSSYALRAARIDDADTIAAFNVAMALETEQHALELETVRRGVRGVFEVPARGHYTVCVVDDEVVGCLLVTTEWSDWRNGDLWWIQSVYVAPAHRGRGVYRALHQATIAAAVAAGATGLRLYVEPENARARATYTALGMRQTYDVMEQSPWPPTA